MKKILTILLLPLLLLSLASCGNDPLNKKYNGKTMWYDIRVGSNAKNDSINHELCEWAIADNTSHGVKNEGLTYRELIDQGYNLLAKTHTETYIDSLKQVYKKP